MSSLDNSWDPVDDTDNLNQKMQIRAINDARSKVRTVRNNAQEQIASASATQRPRAHNGGRRVYLEVVKSYALELAPLIHEHEPDLWDETALMQGRFSYQPSDEDKEIKQVQPDYRAVDVRGLKQFIQTEFPVTKAFKVTYRDTAKGDDPVARAQSWLPSFSEIDVVLLMLDDARKEIGLYLEGPDEVGVESDEPV